MIHSGKCPKCNLPVGKARVETIELNVSRGESYKGVSYLCPFCRAIPGVQMDPLAVNLNLLNRLLAILGRD